MASSGSEDDLDKLFNYNKPLVIKRLKKVPVR